jgi:hypothetical protein
MNASEIRKQAERLSDDRAQAQADVEGCEHLLLAMDATYGARDVQEVRDNLRAAEERLDRLAEAEHHAWNAYDDASQAEHLDYLAEQDNDY